MLVRPNEFSLEVWSENKPAALDGLVYVGKLSNSFGARWLRRGRKV
jgi:hypothetical protein